MGRQPKPGDIFDPTDFQAGLTALGSKSYQALAVIGEEAFELVVAMWVLVMVERAVGQQGLGVYAYLTACLYSVRYLAQYGVTRFIEKETAALSAQPERQLRLLTQGFQAILMTALAGAFVVLLSAGFDTAHTRVQERIGAYVITAIILPVANINALKYSILQGLGKHTQVARLRMLRHGLILGGTFVLTRIPVAPSYLLAAILLAEAMVGMRSRGLLRLPPFLTAFRQLDRLRVTLKKSQAYLFTDNALDVMLNIDLLVLGWFVSSWDLGVYAEAAVLVRFFLIIPAGIKPLLRRQYVILASQNQLTRLADRVRHNTAVMFTLSGVLTVIVLLHFPTVLDLLFETRGEARQSFSIFTVFVPGLLFYGTLMAQEPAYEALGKADELKQLSMGLAGTNFLLTLYLVPAAGFWGAAAATVLTMWVHFAWFGRNLVVCTALDKRTLIVAGMGLYLIYKFLKWLNGGTIADAALVPLLIGLLVYTSGIFGTRSE